MKKLVYIVPVLFVLVLSCTTDEPETIVEFDDTPYTLSYGTLPDPDLPADNKLTKQGVQLVLKNPTRKHDFEKLCFLLRYKGLQPNDII